MSALRALRRRGTLAVALAALLLTACTPPGGSIPEVRSTHAMVPVMPLAPATGWRLDETALDVLACIECAGTDPDPAGFFYGRLPLGTGDALTLGVWPDGSAVDARAALGNMVASGYFGGIYLRSSLASIGAEGSAQEGPMSGALDAIGRVSAEAFDSTAAALLHLADTGSNDEVRGASALWSVLLGAVYGYNLGYLEVTLENPPPGVAAPRHSLECGPLFDCRTPALPMASLDGFADVIANLADPPNLEWRLGSAVLRSAADGSVAGGQIVWERLLASGDFAPDAYESIVELSGGFLQLTQAALLANAAAAFGDDIERGRVGLRLTAAIVMWAGSYFLGLASPLDDSVQPSLTCGQPRA